MLIIIQPRLSSTRLPKKVLYKINGKSLLEYLFMRLNAKFDGEICLASSDKMDDDKIENFCIEKDIPCFRGSLEDVAKRMLDAAKVCCT
mgnify:CR=1 FL=1